MPPKAEQTGFGAAAEEALPIVGFDGYQVFEYHRPADVPDPADFIGEALGLADEYVEQSMSILLRAMRRYQATPLVVDSFDTHRSRREHRLRVSDEERAKIEKNRMRGYYVNPIISNLKAVLEYFEESRVELSSEEIQLCAQFKEIAEREPSLAQYLKPGFAREEESEEKDRAQERIRMIEALDKKCEDILRSLAAYMEARIHGAVSGPRVIATGAADTNEQAA